MIGLPSRGAQLHKWIHQGLPLLFYKRVATVLNVLEGRLREYLGITPSAFSRRVATGRLNTVESDRLCSLVGALDAAYSLYVNDLEIAREWMRSPAMGLASRLPLDMMRSRVEAKAVIDLIGRLESGVCV
ncbi:antitoxin Xre/MbcA/ParS toxin-binding domain-containing protein [Pseudomonas sp. RIT-PI-q]|uniref:antitoxin Xre/MbcA/ParS toxin-binding domain-containing protein n=1 Tax=Pseudomonas sp. RIT-PI-q TaxID=1690247 RepID=UPI00191C6337|nr:antitoxin Xre/MbcA/ParS toxin-binding domain-containing protein [Pseudomonas sp. RIT-PI-q]